MEYFVLREAGIQFCLRTFFGFDLFLWTSPNTMEYFVLIFRQWLRPTRSMYSVFTPQMYFLFLALD